MKLSLYDIIILLGSLQGFFVAFLLSRRKVSNRPASRYLITLVLLVSVLLLGKISFNPKWIFTYPEVILLPDVILYTLGPCLFLFTRHLLRLPPLSNQQLWAHALPAMIYVSIVNTILGQHLSGNWTYLSNSDMILSFYLIEGVGILSISIYLLKSLNLFQDQNTSTIIAPEAIRFLPLFFKAGIGLSICWTISFFIHIIRFDPTYLAYQIFWLLLVAYVYWLAYVVLLKPEIFDLPQLPKEITPVEKAIVQEIEAFMEQQKPYLESNLKISDLANMLNMPSHELSKLINHGFGVSFFDFINSYRVRTFIELRNNTAEAERSILQLAYQAGFNSKSSFNRAFRKMTGSSPSQYFKSDASLPSLGKSQK